MIGLVHDVFPAERFDAEVDAFCEHLASLPPTAMGVAKLTIDLAADIADRGAQRQIDRLANTGLIASPEHLAKLASFLKR